MVIGILFAFKEKEYSIHSPYIRMTWIFFKDYPEDELIDFIQAGADLRHIEDEGIWEYNYEIYVNGAKRVYEDIGRDFNFN
jgi:hypothetical protein